MALLLLTPLLGRAAAPPPPPVVPPAQVFGFHYAFGDDMVLQQAPAKAAVYGFVGEGGTAVKLTVATGAKTLYTVEANVSTSAVHQAYGGAWGVRPCPKESCPPYDMRGWNPWNKPLLTWKALLPPTAANKGGAAPMEYTITAECSGCTANATQVLSGVVFGDMWYCSGQSNMWLPMDHSLSRNETVVGIKAGKFSNVRGMFGGSGNTVDGGKTYHDGGAGYGRKTGSNPWMTASQAIATGSSARTGGSYPLFKMGAACWYFGQRLSELGVEVPIGLADTAIGGQRIEEFMNNATISKCTNRSSENIRWWDGQLFATQVLPFVDMTVKGWVWYQGENNMGSPKGSSLANLGYSCEQRELIRGWREIWSETPGTTDPLAPFGVVTLASSGAEGADAAMGAMRIAQTAGYGVLPSPELPNTFLAQAYDLDDAWGPATGPCFARPGPRATGEFWACCDKNGQGPVPYPRNPPEPSPPSAPIQCDAPGNWLNQTAFIGGTPVAFGGPNRQDKKSTTGTVHANSSSACCSICANATLQKLGCAYWQYFQDRSGPANGQCIMTSTLGNYTPNADPAKWGYSKWATSGGIRKLGPTPPPPPPLCTPTQFARCAPACAAAADTPVAM